MTQRGDPNDNRLWLRCANLAAFWAVGVAFLFIPTLEPNQFGHKICAIGVMLMGIVMFRHPVGLNQRIEVTGPLDRVDRFLGITAAIIIMGGLAVRYAHDL